MKKPFIIISLLLAGVSPILAQSFGLRDAYRDYFDIGVAISYPNLGSQVQQDLITQNFSTLTCENDMKPGPLHPRPGVWNWERADAMADFCRKHGLKMRGHTLCWHHQFCDWMFRDSVGNSVTREVFYQRLRDHIHTVMHRYGDVVYAWDVVNEAIADGPVKPEGESPYRDTPAMRLCGEEYIAQAFRFAREADPKALLFYNDYSMVDPAKRERIYQMVSRMKADGVPIDGIGMQAHYNVHWPSADLLEQALERFSQVVDVIHITEMDVRTGREHGRGLDHRNDSLPALTPEMKQLQEQQYARLFNVFRRYHDVVRNVTFWNLSDRHTWLGKGTHPLLFDENLQPKAVYYMVRDFR